MEDDLPTVSVRLWRADAIVLFDWLMTTDLDSVPVSHPAQKQALADLLSAGVGRGRRCDRGDRRRYRGGSERSRPGNGLVVHPKATTANEGADQLN
ncbi:hypothetical protein AB0G64_37360 [Streptomyces longwoodensis]|uniref:hypothetical protein n=1 Tax=Streptomyces longwoodensis TaxID=68231 RepID=UPI0033CB1178